MHPNNLTITAKTVDGKTVTAPLVCMATSVHPERETVLINKPDKAPIEVLWSSLSVETGKHYKTLDEVALELYEHCIELSNEKISISAGFYAAVVISASQKDKNKKRARETLKCVGALIGLAIEEMEGSRL